MLTDTFSANMETVQPVQPVQTVYSRTIASIQKEDKSVLFTNDVKAATECNIAFVILR